MGGEHNTMTSRKLSASGRTVPAQSLAANLDRSEVNAIDRWLAKALLRAIADPPITLRLWNGERIFNRDIAPASCLKITGRTALVKLIVDPEINFGELYCTGDIQVEADLTDFLQHIYRSFYYKKPSLFGNLLDRFHRLQIAGNRLADSRNNIYHHYDIGNAFYERWLDREAMQYTCAYFPDPDMTLEQAQLAKMHHVCRKLQLEPGLSVVEAGCGWGGLALFMAKHYGVKVKAYNISKQQIIYARNRANNSGLAAQVEFIEDDFRNITGNYDRFVSVGMLEHIGIDNYGILGEVIDRSLKHDGFGLIHTIGRNYPDHLNAWIEKRIFPGACPPSLGQMMNIFEPFALSILDVENLRLHYAMTLEHWLQRFDASLETFRQMYDEQFIRTWRLYLAGSIAGFRSGTLQLFQAVFSRPRNNDLKWSRAHLYPASADRHG